MSDPATRYLLDTDIVSYALRGDAVVVAHVAIVPLPNLVLSRITLAELSVLVHGRTARGRTQARLARLKTEHPFVDLDDAIWDRFALLKADVVRTGRAPGLTGDFDTLQAACALQHGLVLVTNNVRHFDIFTTRFGLVVENWAQTAAP